MFRLIIKNYHILLKQKITPMVVLNLILMFFNLVNCKYSNFEKNNEYLEFIENPTNILISAYFGTRSHVKFILEISQYLQNIGHNITFATAENNLKWADGYNITKISMGKADNPKITLDKGLAGTLPSMYDQFYPHYKRIIEVTKPDVVFCDFFSAACIDYCQENRIPLIIGLQALDSRLAPTPYINDNVDLYIPATTERMSFWGRWYNTFIRSDKGYKSREGIKSELNKVRIKHGIPPRKGRWGDFDTSYKMLNTFIGYEIPRPLHPTFELIGPIRSVNTTPLTDDLTQFLENHDSVMYAAFGSRTHLGNLELNLIIQAGFLALNQGVINGVILATLTPKDSFPEEFTTAIGTVKTKDLFSGKYPQFKVAGFVPQEAILKHKSTKLFVSHGGLESIFETVFTLTPVLVMPFYGDQPGNAQLVIESNIGSMIDKSVISSNKMFEEINKIISDEGGIIKRNLKRVRTIAHYKSIGLRQAGEKILTFAKVAKACRTDNDPKDEYPCEVKHMITVDQKISHFKAYQWDIYTFHYSLVALIIAASVHFGIKYYFEFRNRGYTQIPDNGSAISNRSGHSD
jgi:hypothetical protein